jgi:hypothetical protein
MLEGLSMRWDSIAPVTERDVRRLAADGFIETAAGLLRNKISANGFYAVKDPRMTKLLPFWHKTFRAAAVRPYAVIVFRNPASVVASLQKRDKLSPGHGYLLWAGHMMECLCHAPDFFHFFINYDEFIENPQSVVETAAKHFRLSLDTDELEFLRRDFLSRELRHSNFNTRHLRRDAACPREIVLVCERLEQSGRACPLDADVCLKLAGLLRNCLQRKS